MNFYQDAEFKREENVIHCTLHCKLQLYFNGVKAISTEFEVSDKAKCHPDDEFDEITGRRLAESRASVKAYHKAKIFVKKLKKRNENLTRDLENNINKLIRLETDEVKHVNDFWND